MDPVANFEELMGLVQKHASDWTDGLLFLRDDVELEGFPGLVFAGLENAPAAKRNHHAYKGGLVAHYLEMWQIFCSMRLSCGLSVGQGYINDERILKGIILHDLHKCWREFTYTKEGGFEYSKHPFLGLLRNDQRSAYLASHFGWELDPIQLNALYNSEGGWADSPPKFSSVLAKILYLLDELSGNVKARLEVGGHLFVDRGESSGMLDFTRL